MFQRLNHVLKLLFILALGIETISLVGDHHADWEKLDMQIIRSKDLGLMNIKINDGPYRVDGPDVAYAPVVVDVKGSSVFIIDNDQGK